MWSASSMTVTSTAAKLQCPCAIRSSSRPGQATTMSTPRRSAVTCGFWPTPPKIVREVRPAACASGARAWSIWLASSRVGARMSARGAFGAGRAAVGQPGDQRKQEGIGLARAGAATAEHVAPGKGVRQRGRLDGRRGVDAEARQDTGQACGHADVREGRQVKIAICVGSHRQPGSESLGRLRTERMSRATTCGQLAARNRRADVSNLPDGPRNRRIHCRSGVAHPLNRVNNQPDDGAMRRNQA